MEQLTILTAIAGAILSLTLEYVPYVKDWYAKQTPNSKKSIMGALLIVSAFGAFIVGCYSPYGVAACSEAGAWEMGGAVVVALLAGTATNQTTYAITKR